MKRFRFLIAAALVFCLVQGAWAIVPGGALGGGGKSAQQHPPQEGAVKVEPTQAGGAEAVESRQMEKLEDAPIMGLNEAKPKVEIGKKVDEGQAANEFDESQYAKISVESAKKKEVRRQLKEALKKYREAKQKDSPSSPNDDSLLLYILIAILLPPLAVYLYKDDITTEFWICLILTLIFYVPGLIYALWVILK